MKLINRGGKMGEHTETTETTEISISLFLAIPLTVILIILVLWFIGFLIGFFTSSSGSCEASRHITESFLGWGYQLTCYR